MPKNKKQARYVRGANGVYQRLSDDVQNPHNPTSDLVDGLINELIECGYLVEDPRGLPKVVTHQQSDIISLSSGISNNSKLKLSANDSASTYSTMGDDVSEIGARLNIMAQMIPELRTLIYMVSELRQRLGGMPMERLTGSIFPFIMGMATMLALQAMQPTLVYYGGVFAYYMKLALIYGMCGGGLLWYANVFNLRLVLLWGQSLHEKYAASGSNSSKESMAESGIALPNGDSLLQENDVSENSATPNLVTIPATIPETESVAEIPAEPSWLHEVSVKPYMAPVRLQTPDAPGRPRVARINTDKESRNKVRTRMSPVRPSRSDRRHLSASLHGYNELEASKDREKHYRDLHDMHTHDMHRDIYSNARDPYVNVRDAYRSGLPREKVSKPLPPPVDRDYEDLPLVYEVQLKGLDSPLDRLDTVMSKKSVLGTRANYNKFLSNVED